MAENQLKEVPCTIRSCSFLIRVDFSANFIASLDSINHNSRLSVLLARNNKIKSVSFLLSLVSLSEADLSFNEIDSIEPIHSIVNGTSNNGLKVLNLTGNPCLQ